MNVDLYEGRSIINQKNNQTFMFCNFDSMIKTRVKRNWEALSGNMRKSSIMGCVNDDMTFDDPKRQDWVQRNVYNYFNL